MKAMAMVPTYNEALNIEPLLREILIQASSQPLILDGELPRPNLAEVRERLAARILERAAAVCARRAREGDDYAPRVFATETIAPAFARLLADRGLEVVGIDPTSGKSCLVRSTFPGRVAKHRRSARSGRDT